MEAKERICTLCGDPIDPDQAWLTDGAGSAHSGCVYGHEHEAERDRWMPPEA